ncbi:hypothetical protein [Bowmanella dokdonensis]|uniref:DUF2157 domain-containing protein n=1 Tax=Bowmanella dokdonensis TaxID=751969 RepID=A0A939ILW2_9ALTE|nr:hypothetical protein [Bowmanella dokdonensis]MBN7824638.1 hypothetical protein [Bowmanella dokdonensis]
MYTDEDLSCAARHGILTQESVAAFRTYIQQKNHQLQQDQENFRLLAGFNDIFVVIACGLLLASIGWITQYTGHFTGALVFSAVAWGLAEFFVRRRRMALPAIGLLLAFLGGIFAAPLLFVGQPDEAVLMLSGLLTAGAAFLHWRRFRVPITVAAAVAAVLVGLFALLMLNFSGLHQWLEQIVLVGGLLTFALAMIWDASDKLRVTRRSDVAFWLHLLAAPMLVHPIFSVMGILEGAAQINSMVSVLALYLLLALISLAVDRRALMVSALGYVLYALSNLFDTFGMVQVNFALTGVCIGSALLLLSAFWQQARVLVCRLLPVSLQQRLPRALND